MGHLLLFVLAVLSNDVLRAILAWEQVPQASRRAFLGSLVTATAICNAPVHANDAVTSIGTVSTVASIPSNLQESLSGFVAGASLTVTKTLVKYPLDTATVRLQMPNSSYSIFNPLELFEQAYQGVAAPLVANIPAGAIFFGVKDFVQSTVRNEFNVQSQPLATCIAVGLAQFPYWLVRNPSEVVKTRQQARVDGYTNSTWQGYQNVFNEGTTAFYSGYFENILYAYPADVIKFLVYEQLKRQKVDAALSGAVATAAAQLVTTPLDVVRNRVMAAETSDSSSYGEALMDIYRQEGVGGLLAGATPRVSKALVSGAIQFATYESTKTQVTTWLTNGRNRPSSIAPSSAHP